MPRRGRLRHAARGPFEALSRDPWGSLPAASPKVREPLPDMRHVVGAAGQAYATLSLGLAACCILAAARTCVGAAWAAVQKPGPADGGRWRSASPRALLHASSMSCVPPPRSRLRRSRQNASASTTTRQMTTTIIPDMTPSYGKRPNPHGSPTIVLRWGRWHHNVSSREGEQILRCWGKLQQVGSTMRSVLLRRDETLSPVVWWGGVGPTPSLHSASSGRALRLGFGIDLRRRRSWPDSVERVLPLGQLEGLLTTFTALPTATTTVLGPDPLLPRVGVSPFSTSRRYPRSRAAHRQGG